jgi:hypothetical protein
MLPSASLLLRDFSLQICRPRLSTPHADPIDSRHAAIPPIHHSSSNETNPGVISLLGDEWSKNP